MHFVVTATQFLSVFLTSATMEIISFDCSSDEEEEENNDTSIHLLFKNNILTMHCSDGNFHEEEDDDFEILPLLLLSLLTRRTKWEHQQLAWLDHVKKLQHENMFTQTYQMSLEAFDTLVNFLYENISYKYSKYGFTSSQDPIDAAITIAIGLYWLAVGSYIDLKNVHSCSVRSIYTHRLCLIHAVTSCEPLKLHIPITPAEISASQIQFQEMSSNSVISGCVGAIDGSLVVVKCSSRKDSGNNPSSYNSGQYCCHGLNAQAICDASCCFTFLQLLLQESHQINLLLSVQCCQGFWMVYL